MSDFFNIFTKALKKIHSIKQSEHEKTLLSETETLIKDIKGIDEEDLYKDRVCILFEQGSDGPKIKKYDQLFNRTLEVVEKAQCFVEELGKDKNSQITNIVKLKDIFNTNHKLSLDCNLGIVSEHLEKCLNNKYNNTPRFKKN